MLFTRSSPCHSKHHPVCRSYTTTSPSPIYTSSSNSQLSLRISYPHCLFPTPFLGPTITTTSVKFSPTTINTTEYCALVSPRPYLCLCGLYAISPLAQWVGVSPLVVGHGRENVRLGLLVVIDPYGMVQSLHTGINP